MNRDPWFLIVLMLIVLLGSWLPVFGPIASAVGEGVFLDKLQQWQPLVGALVAVVAALIAFHNTTRTLRNSENQENRRRHRKRAAIRAGLALALAEITEYCYACASPLRGFYKACGGKQILEGGQARAPEFPQLPADAIKTITDLIEYSDETQTAVFENMLVLQIQTARIQGMIEAYEGRGPHGDTFITRHNLVEYIIDTATIYAAANAGYAYGRRLAAEMPSGITWDNVRNALPNMAFYDSEFQEIWETIARRERDKKSPFTYLEARN